MDTPESATRHPSMPPLQLPPAKLRIRQSAGEHLYEVYDTQRERWVALTPEEWVRQHFVAMLISRMHYPASRIANEVPIAANGVGHRCDTVVYGSDRAPWMIVEYKAPGIRITQEVFRQIARYNMILHAPFLVVSNGISHYACAVDSASGAVSFIPGLPEIPKKY